MNVSLRREHQEWLEAQVKAGAYCSVEEAVASILAQRMELDEPLDVDDMEWAKDLVDEGRKAFERGEYLTLEEYRARMDERFGKLKR